MGGDATANTFFFYLITQVSNGYNTVDVDLFVSFKYNTIDKAVMIYKIVNCLCPDSLSGRLIPRSQLSNYST